MIDSDLQNIVGTKINKKDIFPHKKIDIRFPRQKEILN